MWSQLLANQGGSAWRLAETEIRLNIDIYDYQFIWGPIIKMRPSYLYNVNQYTWKAVFRYKYEFLAFNIAFHIAYDGGSPPPYSLTQCG